jgi:hypothetical protein
MCYTQFGAHPNHMHTIIIVKKLVTKIKIKQKKGKKNTTAQIGTNVRARGFGAGLMASNQFASGRSCERPTLPTLSVVFLGPRANAELVPKFHVALHAFHTALPMVTLKMSPYTDVTLTFDFDF